MGIEPTFPRLNPGVLSQLNYGNIQHPHADFSTDTGRGLVRGQPGLNLREDQMGKWRDRTEALHAGNRTRTAKAFVTDGTPSLCWWINDQLRPIEIGVTNRIRTGTNAFTGRDASCYIMITIKWSPWSDSHRRLRVYETRPVASEAQGL